MTVIRCSDILRPGVEPAAMAYDMFKHQKDGSVWTVFAP